MAWLRRILFWTDWDASLPRIEAASMSGQGRKTIHKETGNGGWPNGLTVDYLERRILWIDARLKRKGTDMQHTHAKHLVSVLHYLMHTVLRRHSLKKTKTMCYTQVWCHLFSKVWWFWADRGSEGTWVSVASLRRHYVRWRGLLDGLEDQHAGQGKQVDRKQRHCGSENQHTAFRPSGLPSIQTAAGWETHTHCWSLSM